MCILYLAVKKLLWGGSTPAIFFRVSYLLALHLETGRKQKKVIES